MLIQRLKLFPVILLAGVLFVAACSKDEDPQNNPPAAVLPGIQLTHLVDSNPIEKDTIIYQNEFGNLYRVATLKYFISHLELINESGVAYEVAEVHYVDAFDNATTLFSAEAAIPEGNYSGIRFIFGLSDDLNITGAFPNPPENNMEWPAPMGGGYHYMKLEGRIDSAGTMNSFQAHTGPLMGNPYFFQVTINQPFELLDGNLINIEMEINNWWRSPNLLDLNTVTGIMGNADMQQRLMENGADVFTRFSVE